MKIYNKLNKNLIYLDHQKFINKIDIFLKYSKFKLTKREFIILFKGVCFIYSQKLRKVEFRKILKLNRKTYIKNY